ncbi:hypothetical protein QSV34_07335 [Porticoccus sp. W117]|uniref:hypothetical protein n=1 Tax=Porticoccus sp. W117 TaxID=3054777 RepID=UPI0025929A77|nr:hypothetical protein [Porticoccus sp. W117]MDM3871169.1 hypothetical protein [Porticoccus sp. W117]
MNTPISDNHSNSQPDALDALFSSARTTEPYLRDDGFSDNVIADLPAQPGSRLSAGKKNGIILGSAVLGTGCAAALLPSFAAPANQWLAQISSITIGLPALAAIAAGLLVAAGTVIWANYREWI